MSDDFTLLCDEFGLTDNRRRGLLWHSLCRARAVGGQQVCISLRELIGHPHPALKRPLTLGEIHQAVKFHQKRQAEDLERWHDLPEKYKQEGAGDGTGETPAVCDRDESTAPESGSAEAGECGGCDDVDPCG